MKKSSIVLICVVAVIAIIVFMMIGGYNGIVSKQENVDNQLSNLDTMLQRRSDLIPNLVETVKGYKIHESEVIDNVTEARTKMVNANSVEEKSEADKELTSSLNSFVVAFENYPDLKASEEFTNLMDELSGTENRIAVARKDYNDAVKEFNTSIKRFPNNLLSGMFGFEKAEYFEADEKSSEVPSVDFE